MGFSSVFERPSWQQSAVEGYLSSGVKPPASTTYDAKGRGVPDISALGGGGGVNCWQIRYGHDDGEPSGWGCMAGTSTSAPFVASLVAKLNAARLDSGLSTMGFMNPWLYTVW